MRVRRAPGAWILTDQLTFHLSPTENNNLPHCHNWIFYVNAILPAPHILWRSCFMNHTCKYACIEKSMQTKTHWCYFEETSWPNTWLRINIWKCLFIIILGPAICYCLTILSHVLMKSISQIWWLIFTACRSHCLDAVLSCFAVDFGYIDMSANSSNRSEAQLASYDRYTTRTAPDNDGTSN